MSYDLNFWRYHSDGAATGGAPRSAADHLALYHHLCAGHEERHPDLRDLPLESVRSRVSQALDADWETTGAPLTDATVFWESRSNRAAVIEALFTPQWVRFDLRGKWTGDDANLLIDVMAEFGAPLFDPQVGEHGERFDLPAQP